MEIDTGASRSIMAESTFRKTWPNRKLEPSTVKLQMYSRNEPLLVVSGIQVNVGYESQTVTLPLVVVKGDGPTLMGRHGMAVIHLNWHKIHYTPSSGLQVLLDRYVNVFREELGTFKG